MHDLFHHPCDDRIFCWQPDKLLMPPLTRQRTCASSWLFLLQHSESDINPFVPSVHKSTRITKISILNLEGIIQKIHMSVATMIRWTKRAYLRLCPEKGWKKNSGTKVLKLTGTLRNCCMTAFNESFDVHLLKLVNWINFMKAKEYIYCKWDKYFYVNYNYNGCIVSFQSRSKCMLNENCNVLYTPLSFIFFRLWM